MMLWRSVEAQLQRIRGLEVPRGSKFEIRCLRRCCVVLPMLEKRIGGNHGRGAEGTLDANVDKIRFDFLTRPRERNVTGGHRSVTWRRSAEGDAERKHAVLVEKMCESAEGEEIGGGTRLDREVQARHQETHGRFYERDYLTQPNVHFSGNDACRSNTVHDPTHEGRRHLQRREDIQVQAELGG